MKFSSKTYILLFFVAIIALAYFAYPVAKERYFKEKENHSLEQSESEIKENEPASEENASDTNAEQPDEPTDESLDEVPDSIPDEAEKSDEYLEISREDCEEKCSGFDEKADKEYCQNVCGLSASRTTPKDEKACNELSGLNKDYCLKDLSIEKNNGKICDQIADINIKKTCQNRVLEDFVDQQMESGRSNELLY